MARDVGNDVLMSHTSNNLMDEVDDELEEDIDDDNICAICLDGTVYEDNDILFCDKCNVAVHQSCYGVFEVPEDAWYCYVCAENGDPASTTCELCSNKGGAYKKTNTGKWAHGLCATWIPEIYSVDEKNSILNFSRLDKKRFKLRCAICPKAGACIQCCYGRCTTAAHPWCIMFNPHGFTHRIVKDSQDQTLWEIFCRQHAFAVSEPVRPKPKCKNQPLPISMEYSEAITNQNEEDFDDSSDDSIKLRKSKSKSSPKKARKGRRSSSGGSSGRPRGRPRQNVCYDESDDDDFGDNDGDDELSDDSDYGMDRKNKQKGPREKPKTNDVNSRFKIYTMTEWPGQSEGEYLDLDHFWNIISMYYPEDHTNDWLEFILRGLKLPTFDLSSSIPSLNSLDKQVESTEAIWNRFPSDRDRYGLLDVEKRRNFLASVYRRIEQFSSNGDEKLQQPLNEESFFCQPCSGQASSTMNDSLLHAVFDSSSRVACEFEITKSKPKIDVRNYCDTPQIIGRKCENSFDSNSEFGLQLKSFRTLDDSARVRLMDSEVIAKDEDDEICRILRIDQQAYNQLSNSLTQYMDSLSQKNINGICGNIVTKYKDYKSVEAGYLHQRIWRKVCLCICKGMRDQGADFNKHELEDIPASWSLNVSGRPERVQDSDDDEDQEDAICMCCFDGSSVEGNRILFCDGCNAALHQACYGLEEIPDGDFFCDRCKEVRSIVSDSDRKFSVFELRGLVSCCLCTMYHGGMKRTTDGRWVHLCCAFWCNSSIQNLGEMSSIDVSQVNVQQSDSFRRQRIIDDGSEIGSQACSFCRSSTGYIMRCSGHDDINSPCGLYFHPLCAWFNGIFVTTKILDASFQGLDRDGLFPSCVQYFFFCDKHIPCEVDPNRRVQQADIRRKYRIQDLDIGYSRSKKKRKNKGSSSSCQSRAANSNVKNTPKEIPLDQYDAATCAACISPLRLPSFEEISLDPNTDSPITCSSCQLTFHASCAKNFSPSISSTSFRCYSCSHGGDLKCQLCPRKGGFFCSTIDNKACHLFCAQYSPGIIRVISGGVVDIKMTPKENRKMKCLLCNRRGGVCEKCNVANCATVFHPICGRRNGYMLRHRLGQREIFCDQHIPDGVFRLPNGYWVDGNEIQRMRYTLDRARLILDMISKREKLKKSLNRLESESFVEKYERLKSAYLGGKIEAISDDMDSDNGSIAKDNILEEDDDNNNLSSNASAVDGKRKRGRGRKVLESWSPWIPCEQRVTLKSSASEQSSGLNISANLVSDGNVVLPKKIFLSLAGFEVDKDIIDSDKTQDVFFKKMNAGISGRRKATFGTTGVFTSLNDTVTLEADLMLFLKKMVSKKEGDFLEEMKKAKIDYVPLPKENDIRLGSLKKRKIGNDSTLLPCSSPPTPNKPLKVNFNKTSHVIASKAFASNLSGEEIHDSLKDNGLFGALIRSQSLVSEVHKLPKGFQSILALTGLDANENNEDSFWELIPYNSSEFVRLECTLDAFLKYLEKFSSEFARDEGNESSPLVEDFEQIDDVDCEAYSKSVRQILTIEKLRERLMKHLYRSISSFSKDYFAMLNNARNASSADKVWADSDQLSRIFRSFFSNDVPALNNIIRSISSNIAMEIMTDSKSTSGCEYVLCMDCQKKFSIRNWPQDSSWTSLLEKSTGNSRQSLANSKKRKLESYGWKCPSCLSKNPLQICRQRVQVWWYLDCKAYSGEIMEFHEGSDRYRVDYDDGEWEFISLAVEPVLFLTG